jgi:PPOX class probable F420-dependent enzyme
MDRQQAHDAVSRARVARLATRTRTGRIDLVPITFALDGGGDRLVTAVDHKPKTTTQLKRLDNIAANPEVSVLVDEYDDADWDQLWWVRLRGLATVVDDDPAGCDALVARYDQYRRQAPKGPFISIDLVRWQWWSAT